MAAESTERMNSLLRAVEKQNENLAKTNKMINALENKVETTNTNVANTANSSSTYQTDLECFYGKFNDDFELWFELFELVANANSWSDDRKVKVLPAYLRENALGHYRSLTPVRKANYKTLTDALKTKLRVPEGEKFESAELLQEQKNP